MGVLLLYICDWVCMGVYILCLGLGNLFVGTPDCAMLLYILALWGCSVFVGSANSSRGDRFGPWPWGSRPGC